VVGYHTLLDAHIEESLGGLSDSGGKLIMPVSAALLASDVVISFGNLVDPGVEASREWG